MRCSLPNPKRTFAVAVLLGLALAAASCPGPKPSPDLEVPPAFSRTGDAARAPRWWEAFHDPELNDLMDRALSDNLDLLSAWDRLDQAEAYARIARAETWPEVSANLGFSDQRPGGARTDDAAAAGTMYSLSFSAAYELDLWGRVRAQRRAGQTDLAATEEDLSAMAMTVSAQVAAAWYELVEQELQLKALAEQTEVNRTYLELLELRFGQGMSGASEVLQQRQQLESTQGDLELVTMRRQVIEHQLDALLGRGPQNEIPVQRADLPAPPPLPSTGVPADLLLNRPDARAAKKRYEAAGYRVDQAFAERLPALKITLGASDVEAELSSLFDNWTVNLAVNLLAPLFDAGRRKAAEDRARAQASERLRDLEKVMLTALREVEDALVQEERQARYVASLDAQIESSEQALAFSRQRFANGATDYLPVLINLQTVQRLARTRLTARRTLVVYRINLYRALGGGWALTRDK